VQNESKQLKANTRTSTKPARRTQVQRTADARALLVKAAFNLIRDKGFASFRVAAVAKHAGISQGGQLHHFPTKDAMTRAVIDYAIETAQARTETNLSRLTRRTDLVKAIEVDCKAYYFSDNFDVAMDITKGVAGNPALTDYIFVSHRAYREHTEAEWAERLIGRGWQKDEAALVVSMTASMVRGLAIRAMISPDEANYQRLLSKWRKMVGATYPLLQPETSR